MRTFFQSEWGRHLAAARMLALFAGGWFATDNCFPQTAAGLSAKYPGDLGIEKDPAVFFAENFESGDLKKWDQVRGSAAINTDTLYRALGLPPAAFFPCRLMLDEHGVRLAIRHAALSPRQIRGAGNSLSEQRSWFSPSVP